MKLYKVLNKDLKSSFQYFQFEIGKKYHCEDFDENKTRDCSRGFHAVDVDGLPYAFNITRDIYLVEVSGKNVEIDQYKRRYEYIKIIRKCTKKEIISLAKKKEKKLGYKLSEVLYPKNPLTGKPKKPNKKDINNLKTFISVWASVRASVRASVGDSVRDSVKASVGDLVWASVRASVWASVGDSVRDLVWASVRASVWASVGDSVRDSVRASVWAYISSLFPNIKKWKYIDHEDRVNPYQPAIDLWNRGFISSFDGTTWRLHSGNGAKIVYEYKR